MNELNMFGMPIGFSEDEQKLVPLDPQIRYEDYSRKYAKGMFGLLADSSYEKEDEPYYDFYKAIVNDQVRTQFSDRNLRYDSTVIMSGTANGEYKKTAGHFHCLIPGKKVSYPELYQVIQGTALFIMQCVDDNANGAGKMTVKDLILAEVKAGESIVIPPDYGHCTVNIGPETMVFINLVSCNSQNSYDSVKHSAGMCCYIWGTPQGGYQIQKNPHYIFECEPKVVVPTDSSVLGIQKDLPVYTAFLNSPDTYRYLNEPEEFQNEFFQMMQPK